MEKIDFLNLEWLVGVPEGPATVPNTSSDVAVGLKQRLHHGATTSKIEF